MIPAATVRDAPATTRRGRGLSLSKDAKRRPPSPRPELPSGESGVGMVAGSQAGSRRPSLAHINSQPSHNVHAHQQSSSVHTRPRSPDPSASLPLSAAASPPPVLPPVIPPNTPHDHGPPLSLTTLDDGIAALTKVATKDSSFRSDYSNNTSPEHPSSLHPGRHLAASSAATSAPTFNSDHGDHHGRTLSRRPSDQGPEVDSVTKFAIEHLFNSFMTQAQEKISVAAATSTVSLDDTVESICGPGADRQFDQLLGSMGHVSSKNPKILIDRLISWQKTHASSQDGITLPSHQPNGHRGVILLKHHGEYAAERRSRLAKYIVCRGLLEAFKHAQSGTISRTQIEIVTNILYNSHDNIASKGRLDRDPLLEAYANVVSETLAMIATHDFGLVMSRYLESLNDLQQNLSVKGESHEDAEDKVTVILRSMRFLKLRLEPEHWPLSCELLGQIGVHLGQVHGQNAKSAYCKLLGHLLLPVAAALGFHSPNLGLPAWKKLYYPLAERLTQLASKPKYWHSAFPVMATLVCLAPEEILTSKIHSVIASAQQKLRERLNRPVVLKAICRLVWSYVKRYRDKTSMYQRFLDDIAKTVFWSGKKYNLLNEPAIAEPLIQLTRIICWGSRDVGFKNIILSALNAEQSATKEIKIENLEPERVVVSVRAFLATMRDVERGEDPPFPTTFVDELSAEHSRGPMSPTNGIAHALKRPSVVKEEASIKAIDPSTFQEPLRTYCETFCKLFGKVASACDSHLSGQNSAEEKPTTATPKQALSITFRSGKDDVSSNADDRSPFYDILHVVVQASPRCLAAPTLGINILLNLLCNCATQPDSSVAASAAASLKQIANHGHAQAVVARFSSFIVSPDHANARIADAEFFSIGHFGANWQLFSELLFTWLGEVKTKVKKAAEHQEAGNGAAAPLPKLDSTAMWTEIDRVESHGLLFLCSPLSRVRKLAVKILDIVCMFDETLGPPNDRIMRILENNSSHIVDTMNQQSLSLSERSRLQRGLKSGNISGLLREISGSEEEGDIGLWDKLFPHLIRFCFNACPMVIVQTREDVCARLSRMHSMIQSLDGSWVYDQPSTPTRHVIDCWRFYLTFACITISKKGHLSPIEAQQHSRKTSHSSQKNSSDSFTTAVDVFAKVIPMLSAQNAAIRNAAVIGLGAINVNLYRPLLEMVAPDSKHSGLDDRYQPTHARSTSSPRKYGQEDNCRTEIVHIHKLTAHYLFDKAINQDRWILHQLSSCVKMTYNFLKNLEIKRHEDAKEHESYQQLRIHFCGFLETFYAGICLAPVPSDWMTFIERRAAFVMLEDWCGFYPQPPQSRQRTTSGPRSAHGAEKSRGANIYVESRELTEAALSAMAALCNGPLAIEKKTGGIESFNTDRLMAWVDRLLNDPADRRHGIGRRALKNVITSNRAQVELLHKAIDKFYMASTQKGLEGYVDSVADILIGGEASTIKLWRIISACLVTLGNKGHTIRTKSARLLRYYEEKSGGGSNLYDLDISISDKTTAVNKLAQFEISQRLAMQHPGEAVHVLSEISAHFTKLDPDSQRNLVGAMLPWVQTVELQVDQKGSPTASSYVVLTNLLEMTMKCGQSLHHEMQALWKALASGPHGGNVQVTIDFIIALCLGNKDHSLIAFAKQIVVHLSTTPAGQKVMDFLLMHLTKKNMAEGSTLSIPSAAELALFPHVPDLAQLVSSNPKQSGMFLGHLSLILSVDLLVSPVNLAPERVPLLLQLVFILWDHHVEVVREHAREMLVHLIHEVVLTKLDGAALQKHIRDVENFVESIRRQDASVVWTYEDNCGRESSFQLVPSIPEVVIKTAAIFKLALPSIATMLADHSLDWALTCHVRHLACRSLQIHRCLLPQLDRTMDHKVIIEMLPRLSSTIADDDTEVQVYAAELIRALRAMIGLYSTDVHNGPTLATFLWTVAACLDSVHEWEYTEAVATLDSLLDKADLSLPTNFVTFEERRPARWTSSTTGLCSLVLKGCRSENSLDSCVTVLNRLVGLPTSAVTGDESRILFTLLVNMPTTLGKLRAGDTVDKTFTSAFLKSPEMKAYPDVRALIEKLDSSNFNYDPAKFLSAAIQAIGSSFFPRMELPTLVFLFGLLSNPLSWFKYEVLEILRQLTGKMDMRHSDIVKEGPDLVSPLLRLLHSPEYCGPALSVLDNMVNIVGTALDNQLLRMSMLGVMPDRATRKQYERVKSHYGIPELSGWSVPAPADQKETTRANLCELYYSLAATSTGRPADIPTPEIEFSKDNYPSGSYFPSRKNTIGSEDTAVGEATMEEIVERLNQLDDFFGDDEAIEMSPQSASNNYAYNSFRPSPVEAQRRSPFHKPESATMKRIEVPRNTATLMREPVMSPSAFHAPASASARPSRPGMHPRSATSPAIEQLSHPPTAFPIATAEDSGLETLSDDDLSAGRTHASERALPVESNTVRAMPRVNSVRSFTSRIKKLTTKSPTARVDQSPEVPKVPDVYLMNPRSSDL